MKFPYEVDMKINRTPFLPVIFITLVYSPFLWSQNGSVTDSLLDQTKSDRFSHRIGMEFRHAYILPAHPFFTENNQDRNPIRHSVSGHFKYSFALPESSLGNTIFAATYQGIGVSYYHFQNGDELGKPFSAYLFQRSRIADLAPDLTMDYEWNFGISAGWRPYDYLTNPNNIIIGSRINAYLNFGLYLNWRTNQRLSFSAGADISHFSNGNTEFPNAGLNMTGYKLGVIYGLSSRQEIHRPSVDPRILKFPRHLSYDLVVFGSWRRKGVDFFGKQVPSPYRYLVVGAYFAPMYHLGYRFRTGLSVDAIYDGSANVYTEDYIVGTPQPFYQPDWDRQVALGISARGEYVMPLFTICFGIGTNVLHKGGDFRGTYQSVALKIKSTRNTFIHIGYNLKDFQEPNYLMLGLGYRFNNQSPSLL